MAQLQSTSVTGSLSTTTTITARSATTAASLGGFSVMGAGEFMTTGPLAGYFFENRSGGTVTGTSNWYGWYAASAIVRLYNGSTDIVSINGSSGAITAGSFIRSGGTSAQFLKADGSVDSNSYVTGGPYLALSGGTMTGPMTISTATDQMITLNATDSSWAYLGFSWNGTRRGYFGLNSAGELEIGSDLGQAARIIGTTVLTVGGNTVWHAGNLTNLNQLSNGPGYITQSTADGRYLLGTTSPSTPGNFTLSIGNNGSYSYVQSHSSQPLELNPVGNTVRIGGNIAIHAGNVNSYSVPLRVATNWNDSTVIDDVIGLMVWKNYGNGHVIFDASQSTSPTGSAVNNTNAAVPWTGTYPTLMGWNGSTTYGVRVDSARVADGLASMNISQFTNNSGYVTGGPYLPTAGGTISGTLSFGSQTRQMINLWSTGYGIGVQSGTTYFRSDSRFSWHRGGSHNDNENNPGGGTVAMTLDSSSNLTLTGDSILLSNGSFRWQHAGQWVYAGTSAGNYANNMGVAAQQYWSQGDYYFGTRGVWLSAYLNQAVQTGSSPTFANLTLTSSDTTPINITGGTHKYLTINPGNGWEAMVRYIGGSGSSWFVGKRTSSQLVGTESFHFYSEAAGATVGGVDTGGNIFASGSMRAPIFYDSQNTAYYLDPASSGTSLYMNGGIVTTAPGGTILMKHAVSEVDAWIFQENAPNWGLYWKNAPSGNHTFGGYTTIGAELVGMSAGNGSGNGVQTSNFVGATSAIAQWMISNWNGYIWSASTIFAAGAMRAYEFRGNGNVGGTGEASWHPAGAYIGSTCWQYGDMYKNSTPIYGLNFIELSSGFRITTGPSNYGVFNSWVRLDGHYGFYSGTNGAHFLPNDRSYGSWKILGDRNGWRGLHFGEATGITLMMNEGEFGFHRESVGWVARFTSGTGYFNITGTAGSETLDTVSSRGNAIDTRSIRFTNASGQGIRWDFSSWTNNAFVRMDNTFDLTLGGHTSIRFITNHLNAGDVVRMSIDMGGNVSMTQGLSVSGQTNLNANINYIGRHLDANTAWGSCTSLFLGWNGNKVILGNNANSGHDYAFNLGCNTVVSTNAFFCHQDITAFSDARVKDNVELIEDPIKKVQAIRGVTFTRNDIDDKEKRHAGVIAQEVREVLPEVVSEDQRGYCSVAYGNLTSLLIEAIKEQQAQIEDLKNQIAELKENK